MAPNVKKCTLPIIYFVKKTIALSNMGQKASISHFRCQKHKNEAEKHSENVTMENFIVPNSSMNTEKDQQRQDFQQSAESNSFLCI